MVCLLQSHFLDSPKHAFSTYRIISDVLYLDDENKPNFDMSCDLFSDIYYDEITRISSDVDESEE